MNLLDGKTQDSGLVVVKLGHVELSEEREQKELAEKYRRLERMKVKLETSLHKDDVWLIMGISRQKPKRFTQAMIDCKTAQVDELTKLVATKQKKTLDEIRASHNITTAKVKRLADETKRELLPVTLESAKTALYAIDTEDTVALEAAAEVVAELEEQAESVDRPKTGYDEGMKTVSDGPSYRSILTGITCIVGVVAMFFGVVDSEGLVIFAGAGLVSFRQLTKVVKDAT